jgi:ribonuclease P protein component
MPSYPKSNRLRNRSDFDSVRRAGKEFVGVFFRVRLLPSSSFKLGLIVSRKFGKSTIRNRFKRLIRESFRHLPSTLAPCHIVVLPRIEAKGASYQDLFSELEQLVTNCQSPVSADVV